MRKPLMFVAIGLAGLVLGLAGCGDDNGNGETVTTPTLGTTTDGTTTIGTSAETDTFTLGTTTDEDDDDNSGRGGGGGDG